MAPVAMIVYQRRVVWPLFLRASNSLVTNNMRYDWVFRGIKLNDQPIPCTDLLYMYRVK